MSLNNINIKQFVNGWIPSHLKWDIMSYVLECPFKKEELQQRIKDLEFARVDEEEIPDWMVDVDALEVANDEWAARLDDHRQYDPIHFNGFWKDIKNERFYLKFFTSPHIFVSREYRHRSTFPKHTTIKKWLNDNKVKGRSQYKSAKDWKIAAKLIMSVQ